MPLFMLPRLRRKWRNRKEREKKKQNPTQQIQQIQQILSHYFPFLFSFALLFPCNISFFLCIYHCLLLSKVQRQSAFIKERQYWLIYHIASTFFDQFSMHISSFEKHFMNHWTVWKNPYCKFITLLAAECFPLAVFVMQKCSPLSQKKRG